MMLSFCKMHGLGNDFMVMDTIHQSIDIKKIPISSLADRHLGIGFDQLLIISKSAKADFACRIFNADGSEAEQCGNGMRAVARYVKEQQLTQKTSLTLETISGVITVTLHNNDQIEVFMGMPSFEPEKNYEISVDSTTMSLPLTVLSLGNPHAILQVASIFDAPVKNWGPKIAAHPAFPKGANVGFMEIVNPKHIRLRTFERGVGETLACGSNACAAVVAGILNYGLDHKVNVELTYGNLLVEWANKTALVTLSGSATRVYNGTCFI